MAGRGVNIESEMRATSKQLNSLVMDDRMYELDNSKMVSLSVSVSMSEPSVRSVSV